MIYLYKIIFILYLSKLKLLETIEKIILIVICQGIQYKSIQILV